MKKPHLYRVIFPVRDIERAVGFYRRVLGLAGERVSPGRHYFKCGGTILACYDPVADGDDTAAGWVPHENQYVYFAVSDLSETRERVVEAGASRITPIRDMPWGEKLFYADDPVGGRVCFVDETTMFTGSA